MESIGDYRRIFEIGKKAFYKKDYMRARCCFETTSRSNYQRELSLFYLLKMAVMDGNFSCAREILNENRETDDKILIRSYGLLENAENNFEQSLKYYQESLKGANNYSQDTALLSIAKLYLQIGEHAKSKSILERLRANPEFLVQASFGLIFINLLENNFEECERILDSIDNADGLPPILREHIANTRLIIKYLSNQIINVSDYSFKKNHYLPSLLTGDNDVALLTHLTKHYERYVHGYWTGFFKDIDLESLVVEGKDRIKDLNPNHFELSDMYRFRMDRPIGYKYGKITQDICVSTIIGTKKIMTMYPILLSSEFDKEGASTSKALKMKRLEVSRKK